MLLGNILQQLASVFPREDTQIVPNWLSIVRGEIWVRVLEQAWLLALF